MIGCVSILILCAHMLLFYRIAEIKLRPVEESVDRFGVCFFFRSCAHGFYLLLQHVRKMVVDHVAEIVTSLFHYNGSA